MKISPVRFVHRRGSAVLMIVFLITVMALLTGSLLKYTVSERRGNERNRLILRARNMSENISAYAAEQITTKLYRLRSFAPIAYMTGTNEAHLPPDDVLDTAFTSADTGMEVRAGLTGSTGYVFINPATYPNNPNAGLQVNTSTIPIIAMATATHPVLGSYSAYTEYDLEADMVPLFQFAIFYNMDMEFGPGGNMVIAGPIHTNGNLIARNQTGLTNTVQFLQRVSAAGGFFANTAHKGPTYMGDGGVDNGPGGTGPLRFQNPAGTVTDIYGSSTWRDHKYGKASVSTTTLANFKTFASSWYGVNFRTSVHGVTPLVLPGVADYSETDDPATTGVDERDNGRQIIEPADASDTAQMKETKFGRRAGLYIIVNPDDQDRPGILPDASTVTMRARSYRCWLNTVNADLTHTLYEVILPGQPSYGSLNANINDLPNAYRIDTSVGPNQVLRIPQGGAPDVSGAGLVGTGYTTGVPTMASFQDAYFYDLRRARNNTGGSPFSRPTNNYIPRPITKIDFDMTRFRMVVDRTVSSATTSLVYNPSQPNAGNWASSIFNSGGARANYGLGLGGAFNVFPTGTTLPAPDPFRMYFAPADPLNPLILTNPGTFGVSASHLVNTSAPSPWFDGITIYIHSVDAEVRTDTDLATAELDRIDSGVRLWNGRGPVISLDGATYPSRTGLSFGTNDAAYIIGHYNADGTIISASGNTSNPGGYSAQYPESNAEKLTSVMADAVTILSQPLYSAAAYAQTSGWSDSMSATRSSSTNYSAAWSTTNPSGTNSRDGLGGNLKPAAMPNFGNQVAGPGATVNVKLPSTTTEISTALLVGLVPTNHNPSGSGGNNQTSGGVHNFPRLLEVWGSGPADLYIRGSMVAMFESRVAMEPWSIRYYAAPGRFWGLHESLRTVNHDLPLEPILLNARRVRFKELTSAQYATQKAVIEALPH
jgi:hypothetical protein